MRRWQSGLVLDRRIQHNPLQRHPEAAFGRALQSRWVAAPSLAHDLDLPASDNVTAPAAKALFVNRFPRMENVQATESIQSLLDRQM